MILNRERPRQHVANGEDGNHPRPDDVGAVSGAGALVGRDLAQGISERAL
jgi:hypothetical protein